MTDELEVQEAEPVDPIEIEQEPTEIASKPKARTRKPPEITDPDDAILELRAENQKLRKKLQADSNVKAEKLAEERIKVAREEAVAEAQRKLDERIVEMEERARSRVLKAEVRSAAQRAGVADFDDLYAVMNATNVLKKIEFDTDGNVVNVGDVIAEMKTAKPHLFAGVSTSSTTTAPQSRQHVEDKPVLKMSKEDYEKAKQRLFTGGM